MIKQKGLKLVIWALLITLSASCLLILASHLHDYLKNSKTHNEALNGQLNATNADLTISNLEEFKAFAESVRKTGVGTYYGKCVVLTADIDCNGEDIRIGYRPTGDNVPSSVDVLFQGTFDGQGHTISNLTLTEKTTNPGLCGLFVGLENGTIKNVHFDNITFKPGFDGYYKEIGLVGYNGGTIENCIISNISFQSNRFKSNCSVGAIAGENYGTIKNCLVSGNYTIGGKDKGGMFNSDGLYAHYFKATGHEVSEVSNCIFAANVVKNPDWVTSESYTPAETEDSLGESNYSSCSDAHANMDSSVADNTGGEEGTPWYKYNKTSSGEYRGYETNSAYSVYLRYFMDWTTYTFLASPFGAGTVSKTSLIVPTEYNSVSIESNTVSIYEETITATPNEGNEFDKWEKADIFIQHIF